MVNAALVGLGWWGRTILKLLQGNAKLRIVKAVDVTDEAAAFAREQRVDFARELDVALADPAVDAVILCTPHTLHTRQIVRAANARKHVFCEKPLSLARADVEQAVAACNANGVALAVGHERRFEPPMLELQRLATSGTLGTVLQVEANFSQNLFLALAPDNWRLSSKEAPAGPMTATGIHMLDLSVGLCGPAKRVLANVRRLGSNLANGDTLAILVDFESGANALISAILATPFDGRFAVYGTKGWAEVRDKSHPQDPKGWTLLKSVEAGKVETVDYPAAFAVRDNLEAFADAAAGRAPYPVPQEQMIWNIAALEAIVKSAASGKIEMVG
ncbi:MAG TPA: Gfo/Idh/MocA family oxidoreductase [Candidatus Sulfotelmatobacter sp.]|nr:Gfo/Idh/MocA family oxidoreductase [Candidatus Sulfotelmatobacter sp.]